MYGLRNHVFGPLRDGSAADNCKAGPEGLFCAANRFAGASVCDVVNLISKPAEKELSMCFNNHHLKVDYKDGDKWALTEADRRKLKQLFADWQMGME